MSTSLYQQEMLEHAEHPQNFGTLDNPDLQGRRTNPTCGDEITMALKFTDEKISSVAFAGSGCSVSQAWASMLTEWIKDKTREELAALTEQQHLALLDVPLTPSRQPCALLSLQALKEALKS